MNEEIDPAMETARLGIEAEAFLISSLGRYLFDRAEKEIEAAVERLVDADPEDAKLGREIRNEIYRAESVMEWIINVVNDGRTAHAELRQQDDLAGAG